MSVGGVGAAGSASGSAAITGVAAGGGSTPAGGPSGGGGISPSPNGEASTKDISDAGDKAGIAQPQNNSMYTNMSTQDSMELHNSVHGIGESHECGEMDIQKLIEMMMAIKLLEAMNGDQGSSGGFSATG
jgi:hypothetical protein